MAKAKLKAVASDSATNNTNPSALALELRALLESGQFEIVSDASPELAAVSQRLDHFGICIQSLNTRLDVLEKAKAATPPAPARYNPRGK